MINLKIKKLIKIFSLCLLPAMLVFALFFTYNYNKNREEALAQGMADPLPIICQDGQEIKTIIGTFEFDFLPNELEIPIGETVDEAQARAKEIIAQIDRIIPAASSQISIARSMVFLPNQCTPEKCQTGCQIETKNCCPYSCNCRNEERIDDDGLPYTERVCDTCHRTCHYCQAKPCVGDYKTICPYQEFEEAQEQIKEFGKTIADSYQIINDIFFKQRNLPFPYTCPKAIPWCETIACPSVIQNPLCKTDIGLIEQKLKVSRERTAGCVMTAEDLEERLRGEMAGRFLYSCSQALTSYLVEECYGQAQCLAKISLGEDPPAELPCAENYFCCK